MKKPFQSPRIVILFTLILSLFGFPSVQAGELSPEMQVKLTLYKTKLSEWAKNPVIVKAVMQANSSQTSMDNKIWKSLLASDTKVRPFLTSSAGKKLLSWEQDQSIGKLFLRDKKGNFVAGSKKPAIFNISKRPAFLNAIRGKIWNSKKPKTDPTTKLSSIQLSIPVINQGKKIGILHTSINAN
ncbi:GAF domain-containing protein [Beggiatoa alba]|nr:GAF domain-containing protein [Beggiatoa alba]